MVVIRTGFPAVSPGRAPVGTSGAELLFQAIANTLDPALQRAIDRTYPNLRRIAPEEASRAVPQIRATARQAARLTRLARLHPATLIADVLIHKGLDYLAESLLERLERAEEEFPEWGGSLPFGDIGGPGWTKDTAAEGSCNGFGWTFAASIGQFRCGSTCTARLSDMLPDTAANRFVGNSFTLFSTQLAAAFSGWNAAHPENPYYTPNSIWKVTGPEPAAAWPAGFSTEEQPALAPMDDTLPQKVERALGRDRPESRSNALPQSYQEAYAAVEPRELANALVEQALQPSVAAEELLARALGHGRLPESKHQVPDKATWTNPGPRVREKKIRVRLASAMWILRKGAEEILERCDQVNAVYHALPPAAQRATRQQWVETEFDRGVRRPAKAPPCDVKAKAIAKYYRAIDADQVTRELAWEWFSDMLYGKMGQATNKAVHSFSRTQRPVTATGGEVQNAGLQHPLNPTIPTEIVDWRDREGFAKRVQNSEANVQIMVDEAIRRTRNARRTRARKIAYREAAP